MRGGGRVYEIGVLGGGMLRELRGGVEVEGEGGEFMKLGCSGGVLIELRGGVGGGVEVEGGGGMFMILELGRGICYCFVLFSYFLFFYFDIYLLF